MQKSQQDHQNCYGCTQLGCELPWHLSTIGDREEAMAWVRQRYRVETANCLILARKWDEICLWQSNLTK